MSLPDRADLAGFLEFAGVIGVAAFPIVYWYLGSDRVAEKYENPKRFVVALLISTVGIVACVVLAAFGQRN